jgi:ATP-dependent Zn protease
MSVTTGLFNPFKYNPESISKIYSEAIKKTTIESPTVYPYANTVNPTNTNNTNTTTTNNIQSNNMSNSTSNSKSIICPPECKVESESSLSSICSLLCVLIILIGFLGLWYYYKYHYLTNPKNDPSITAFLSSTIFPDNNNPNPIPSRNISEETIQKNT